MPRYNSYARKTQQDRAKPSSPGSHRVGSDIPHNSLPMYPYAAFGPLHMSSANGVPFVLHPCAFGSRNFQRGIGGDVARNPAVGDNTRNVTVVQPGVDDGGHLAEQRVSQAAKQLHAQISQSKGIYDGFHKSYEKDIKRIGEYVTYDIQRQIWEEKVERNRRHKTGLDEEDQQLTYQRDKLMTCLGLLDKAAGPLAHPCADDRSHDSRQFQLEKIQAAGSRVSRLTKKVLSSEAACQDLVAELNELSNLLDPKNTTAKVLYRFDQRVVQAASQLGQNDDDVQAGNSDDEVSEKKAEGKRWQHME